MEVPDYVYQIFKNTTTFDLIVTAVGGAILVMLKKWVRPMWIELTKGQSRTRVGDTKFTVKDLLIENYRAMERIHSRQDRADATQAEMIGAIGEIRGSVQMLNTRLEDHLKEANPLLVDIKRHLKEHE